MAAEPGFERRASCSALTVKRSHQFPRDPRRMASGTGRYSTDEVARIDPLDSRPPLNRRSTRGSVTLFVEGLSRRLSGRRSSLVNTGRSRFTDRRDSPPWRSEAPADGCDEGTGPVLTQEGVEMPAHLATVPTSSAVSARPPATAIARSIDQARSVPNHQGGILSVSSASR